MRPIADIARDIRADMAAQAAAQKVPTTWRRKYWAAAPYIDAAECISTCRDSYGADSGTSVVLYLLSNLSTYRGDKAKALKAELKEHTK